MDTAIIDIAGDETTMGRRVTGTFRQFAKKRLTVSTAEQIPSNAAVFVNARELVFLGEVASCDQLENEYSVEIAVRQALARM